MQMSSNVLFAALFVCATVVLVAGSGSGNPFEIAGIKYYVNSDYLAEVRSSIDMEASKGNTAWGQKAEAFGHVPSAYWLDTMAKVGKLMVMMEEAVNFAKEVKAPVLTSFVIYDVPTRDCYALSSNGEIQLTGSYEGPAGKEDGIGFYKSSYIDPIYTVIKRYDSQSPQIVTVLFIEPDSLPNIVTNKGSRNCSEAVCAAYITAQTYTIKALGQLKSAWMYMDLAHGGWLGYKDNLAKADGPFKTVLSGQENLIRGFVTNSANYSPLLFTTGWSDLTSKDTDYCLDELTYYGALAGVSSLFAGKNLIIDTGRNGLPGKRTVMGNWCNIYNTGIGLLPGLVNNRIDLSKQACPARTQYDTDIAAFCKKNAPVGLKALDALWWIKTPGESDGISENKPGARLDTMCQSDDSWWKSTKGSDAPEAGQWFHLFFVDLISNAVETPQNVDLCAPNPCANAGVCSAGKCTCSGGWGGTYCTTPPTGCNPNPCKNYGTCASGGKCTCPVGFSGDTCETTSGGCDSAPGNQCFNGGACSGTPWKCACKTGFSGTMCQDAPKCNPNPCKNGGTCFGSPLGNACFCPRGWMGVDCTTSSGAVVEPVADCSTVKCGSHATCSAGACSCDAGYKAAASGCVEDVITPGDLCANAGCQDKCNSATGKCSCTTGTLQADGVSCSTVVTDPCNASPKPCSTTTQTCTATGGKAVCKCKTGYHTDPTATNKCVADVVQTCTLPCSGICISATEGCGCDAGQVLADDQYTCVDEPTQPPASTDPCKVSNGGCNQLCTAKSTTVAVCSCNVAGYTLNTDKKTCYKPTTIQNKCAPLVCAGSCVSIGGVAQCACDAPLKLAANKYSCSVTTTPAGDNTVTSGGGSDALIIVLIILIVLVVLAAVGFFIYKRMSNQSQFNKNTAQMGGYGQTSAPYGQMNTNGSYQPAPPPAGGRYGAPPPPTGGYGYGAGRPAPPPPRM